MSSAATLVYVPKLDKLYPRHFLENVRHYKHSSPIIFYSDFGGGSYADFIQIPSPQPLKQSKNKIACQNFLFLHAVRIAKEFALDRFLYLELDCRVGCDNWDQMMLDEWRDGAVVAGTPNLFNTEDMPKAHEPAVQSYMADYSAATGLPVAQFLANPRTKRLGSCMFMMGAGAIYDTDSMFQLFPNFTNCISSYACRTAAFDLHIGLKLFQMHGAGALERMPFLTKSFSGFGNKVLNIERRVERLRTGKACLIHQYKHKSNLLFQNERERLPSVERPGCFNQPIPGRV